MNFYEMKDSILKFLNEQRDGDLFTATDIRKRLGLTAQDHHLVEVSIKRMVKDEYVKEFDPGNVYQIHPEGKLFLEAGGYSALVLADANQIVLDATDKMEARRRDRWDRRREWVLAIVAIGLAMLNVVQYLKCH